ncbi:hypothetical protein AVEN_211148-1 [Araneus ventricosus]|uniref:Uncharacterized protein n=1 Tax=Araneus ventricosus TaxID=182803 RepID=A0A4Y2TS72_ARAVE|nr:hypothetical protein AVEN_211148-1 [Araneus ventricosus]
MNYRVVGHIKPSIFHNVDLHLLQSGGRGGLLALGDGGFQARNPIPPKNRRVSGSGARPPAEVVQQNSPRPSLPTGFKTLKGSQGKRTDQQQHEDSSPTRIY